VETCEEPEFYEYAQAGKRIVAPEDLDNRDLAVADDVGPGASAQVSCKGASHGGKI